MGEHWVNLDGPQVSLKEVLQTREWRAAQQAKILTATTAATLIWSSTRIPGPIKTGSHLTAKYQAVAQGIMHQYEGAILDMASFHRRTGFEFYVLVNQPAERVKHDLVLFEEQTRFGQLCDFDVLRRVDGQIMPVHRQQLGLPQRRCLICDGNAKICSRSRRHGLTVMQAVVDDIIAEGWREV
ncbi:citrate lyase holo-[acyl-carrier protein] synthase [Lactiplantibacillus pentosus]|jgi:holo-ACP synthase|uniref:citrate lyase holo-[acyl-carrier protein] synthase n=1 Tax=Lactiplantibacillus pentosus TaxID=1589 RepID=UPI001CFFE42F|nr:citrate lyase holo-[acyl-carrier protein] synthase [Lactiplantibacillus pentosus]MCB5221191.1 citrate lyase holo-[acyl-carrier protein] synthase [Lactiplantibacillus pentosus]MCT3287692.1 citrate lyase holo-[acyl-carrier protein] synthase [Lactiplantibacillus pentosus]MCT3290406.1 citrate lyase holo-[acyl-carrier protein] synthase [Lactiplantibacillus pentosus]USJ86688.1 citrate lyase holo-[acyl-carrier protein] synthase [Lactiplantibacillus pentosus]